MPRTVPIEVMANITGLDEYKRIHAFEEAVRVALTPGRMRGITPDGVTTGEVLDDVATALRELDDARTDSKREAELAVEVKTPEVWEENRRLKRRVAEVERDNERLASILGERRDRHTRELEVALHGDGPDSFAKGFWQEHLDHVRHLRNFEAAVRSHVTSVETGDSTWEPAMDGIADSLKALGAARGGGGRDA